MTLVLAMGATWNGGPYLVADPFRFKKKTLLPLIRVIPDNLPLRFPT
jgi:hypothetical protein